MKWRETFKGEYWKCGDYRIEYRFGEYNAMHFSGGSWSDLNWHSTWELAKAACETHERDSKILPFGGQYKGNDGRPVGGHAPIA